MQTILLSDLPRSSVLSVWKPLAATALPKSPRKNLRHFSDPIAGLRRSGRGCCFPSVEMEGSRFCFSWRKEVGAGRNEMEKRRWRVLPPFQSYFDHYGYNISFIHRCAVALSAQLQYPRVKLTDYWSLSCHIYLQFVQNSSHPKLCCWSSEEGLYPCSLWVTLRCASNISSRHCLLQLPQSFAACCVLHRQYVEI